MSGRMGRPKVKQKAGCRISGIMVPEEVLDRLDTIVKQIPNMTRAQLCSNLLLMSLEDVELLNGLGVFSSMRYIRGTIELVKEVAQGMLNKTTKC